MTCSEVTERLSEFLEGDLSSREQEEVAAHLASCAACRRERDELEELIRQAAELPEEVPPRRDLWPGIRERLAPRVETTRASNRHAAAARRWWPVLAAAAVLVVGFVVLLDLPAQDPGLSGADWSVMGFVQEYQALTRELASEVQSRQSVFPASARTDLDRNLAVIDEAIARSRNALSEHPGSRQLRLMLSDNYERKVELLRWAARISAELDRG